MKKYLFNLLVLLLVAGCSPPEEKSNADMEEEVVIKEVPTEEKRDAFLESNEFIEEFEHTSSLEKNEVYLSIKMKNEFTEKTISDQYLYLLDFYEEYNDKFKELFPSYSFLNYLQVYVDDTEFPTYEMYNRSFRIVAEGVDIDREVGQRPSNKILELLNTLDKKRVMSGTKDGLTLSEVENGTPAPIKKTLITMNEEVKGALSKKNTTVNSSKPTGSSKNNQDTETYIRGMTGSDWILLTDNQKFHAVSNALYALDQNGYSISKSEVYYINALNAFYTDTTVMDIPVDEALISIGAMSQSITN